VLKPLALSIAVIGTANAAPRIDLFQPDSAAAVPSQSITFQWSVSGATTVKLDNQVVTGTTATRIVPASIAAGPVSYTLAASDGTTTATRVVTLRPGTKLNGQRIPEAYTAGCTFVGDDILSLHPAPRIEPRDCTEIKVDQPVFVWPLTADAPTGTSVTLRLRKLDSGGASDIFFTGTSTSSRLILPPKTLTPGVYGWTVSYVNRRGEVQTSNERHFTFNTAVYDNMPDADTVAQAITARDHPRILPRNPDNTVMDGSVLVQKLLAARQRASYDDFIAAAQKAFESAIVAEPLVSTTAFAPTYEQMLAIERLASAAYMNTNLTTATAAAYRRQAIDRMLATAKWNVNPGGATTESGDDQANRIIIRTLALGLDLLAKYITNKERDVIIPAINARIQATVAKLDGVPGKYGSHLGNGPLDSHNLSAGHYVAQALMHASGIEGETQSIDPDGTLLRQAWTRVVTNIGSWGGSQDSALGDGTYYGWMGLDIYAQMLAAYRIMADARLANTPPFANMLNNMIAFTPRHLIKDSLMSPFGDSAQTRSNYLSYGYSSYRLFGHVSGREADRWYSAEGADPGMRKTIYSYLMYGVADEPAITEPILPSSYLFEDAGMIAMHTKSADPKRSSLYFRSSRLGMHSHNVGDNNAFTFVSKGEDIFISGGIYEKYDDDKNNFHRQTRFKNAMTFDGGKGQGQVAGTYNPARTMKASGKLVNYYYKGDDTPGGGSPWTIATGDATDAYREFIISSTTPPKSLLTKAFRTVAYNRQEGIAVIYDYAASDTPRRWEVNFQTLRQPTLPNASGRKITVARRDGSKVCVEYHGYNGSWSTESMGDYYAEPLIDNPEKPGEKMKDPLYTQYHTRYTTDSTYPVFAGVTVILENCADPVRAPVTWSSGGAYTFQFGNSALHFNQDKVQISE
jgi:Heparinase II/III-like protein